MQVIDYREYSPSSQYVHNQQQVYHPILSEDVNLSDNAKMTLHSAVTKIAEYCQVPKQNLLKKMDQEYFWMEPSGILVILVNVEEIDADMFVEIPPNHWWIDNKTPCD
jgi:hypothetical protein